MDKGEGWMNINHIHKIQLRLYILLLLLKQLNKKTVD